MNCFIIRDLLPLYEAGLCSKDTVKMVEEHIKNCHECREIFSKMNESLISEDDEDNIKDSTLFQDKDEKQDREFWMKYYKSLYFKAIGIFIIVYGILAFIALILKY